MSIRKCKLIDFPVISDVRGNISFVEENRQIPFKIMRVYYLYDVPSGASRGGHAHKLVEQILIALSGSFDVMLDDGHNKKSFFLNRSYCARYQNRRRNIAGNPASFKSGCFILGEETKQFEAEFSKYVGARFGLGMNSGSDALYLAVKALGISIGDEVITVSHTMISTVDAITRNGAKPIFVGIEPETYVMDVSKVEAKISDKTRAILPVHLYGQSVDMAP